MIIDENTPGIIKQDHGYIFKGDLEADNLDIRISLTVTGWIKADGWIKATGSIEAKYMIQAGDTIEVGGWVKANGWIIAGSWIEAGGSIESGGSIEASGWIEAGGPIKVGNDIIAGRWVQSGGPIEVSGSIKAGGQIVAGDQIKQESLVTAKDQDRLVEFLLEMNRIYEGLTKTEDQVKQEQSAKEAFSKIPKEALKLMTLDSPPLIQDSFLKGDRIAVGSSIKTEDQNDY